MRYSWTINDFNKSIKIYDGIWQLLNGEWRIPIIIRNRKPVRNNLRETTGYAPVWRNS